MGKVEAKTTIVVEVEVVVIFMVEAVEGVVVVDSHTMIPQANNHKVLEVVVVITEEVEDNMTNLMLNVTIVIDLVIMLLIVKILQSMERKLIMQKERRKKSKYY